MDISERTLKFQHTKNNITKKGNAPKEKIVDKSSKHCKDEFIGPGQCTIL